MADFRKWFLAFAVLALFTSFAVPASAQLTPALQCVANAGVPPTVRAEGLTELVGDLVLNCTGGIPTQFGQVVPQANVTIFLSVPITSRLIDSANTSEALLLIDEPHSVANPTTPLRWCSATGLGGGTCQITGTGNGIGTYNGDAASGSTPARVNAFSGRQTANSTSASTVTFFGIPIDPPGTTGVRIIRITNVRGNANYLGVSSTLVPTQITEYVSITGSTSVPVNNPQQTVAFVQPGLSVSTVDTVKNFIQCADANKDIAGDSSKALQSGGQNGQQFSIRFTEGFGTAWKVRNVRQNYLTGGSPDPASWAQGADFNQNVPGAIYNTETGFNNNATDPSPNPPNYSGTPALTTTGSGNWPSTIGTATQGTRLMIQFNSVPTGTQLFVPVILNTVNVLTTSVNTGIARLVSTDANGAGAFSSITATSSSGVAPVTITGTTGIAVYEIVFSDPFAIERLTIPVAVAYAANVGSNLPQPGVTATATGSFAPLSTIGIASSSAPIPRFAPSVNSPNLYKINKCSCNILFPYVVNVQGYDTGIAIANTTVDPFGTAAQQGIVTLNYYSGGTPPPAQKTNAPVPGGQTLAFTLGGGGTFGIAATPGFSGYIIAQAEFQYCHGYAYISAFGALPTAPGASASYLGLILDAAGLERTGQIGENKAH